MASWASFLVPQLSNGDHTPAVVRHALDKHGLEGDPDEFVLAQQLPDSGEDKPLFSGHCSVAGVLKLFDLEEPR